MNDDFDKLLKNARVPERSPGYWEHFPKRVTAQLTAIPVRHRQWLPWTIGLATVCVVLAAGIFIGRSNQQREITPVSYTRLFREIEGLFPNQLQAIVVDQHGVKLVLSETADVPKSQPLLIQACRQDDCRQVITFSGQQVKVNGDMWDVLVNGQNQVVVAGRSTDRYHIEAKRLGDVL